MLASDAFAKADVEQWMAATPDLTNLRPSYTHAMSYGYHDHRGLSIRQHPRDNMVVVALRRSSTAGGGQRSRCLMERARSRLRAAQTILDRLRQEGFREGLEPHRPPIGPMHALTPMLLEAFSSQESGAPHRLATQSPVASATQYRRQTTTPTAQE